jgi:hypothetical protein
VNQDRRKAISKVIEDMSATGGLDDLDGIADQIEDLRNEEQDYFDNMPESFQGGEKGEIAEAAIGQLDEALEAVREMLEKFNEAIEALGEAQQ